MSLYAAVGIDRHSDDNADTDGFGAHVRHQSSADVTLPSMSRSIVLQACFETSISLLTAGLKLIQSVESLGDLNLIDILHEFENEHFLVIAPSLWASIAHKECNFEVQGIDRIMKDIQERLGNPKLSHNSQMHALVVSFLRATMDIWLEPAVMHAPAGMKARDFLSWLMGLIDKGSCQSWNVREQIVSLLDQYVGSDSRGAFWSTHDDDDLEPQPNPVECLKKIAQDRDVRVRYKGAIAVARLFRAASEENPNNDGSLIALVPFYGEIASTQVTLFEKYVHRDYFNSFRRWHLSLTPGMSITSKGCCFWQT
jgi:hypothetical protein